MDLENTITALEQTEHASKRVSASVRKRDLARLKALQEMTGLRLRDVVDNAMADYFNAMKAEHPEVFSEVENRAKDHDTE